MSTENNTVFTRENLDLYLKELAKEYRKLSGKSTPAEIILIGGAAILERYGFRDMTTDVDAIIRAASSMKEAANRVRDRFDLPVGWLNADFMQTDSYTPKLIEHAVYYKTYSNVVTIRTVAAEYLIAMKLRSLRTYKHDYSDVVGIIKEQIEKKERIPIDKIQQAYQTLYEQALTPEMYNYVKSVCENDNIEDLFYQTVRSEHQNRDKLRALEDAGVQLDETFIQNMQIPNSGSKIEYPEEIKIEKVSDYKNGIANATQDFLKNLQEQNRKGKEKSIDD